LSVVASAKEVSTRPGGIRPERGRTLGEANVLQLIARGLGIAILLRQDTAPGSRWTSILELVSGPQKGRLR